MTCIDHKYINYLIKDFKESTLEVGKVSDGYHTFDELYDHRVQLFITLCNTLYTLSAMQSDEGTIPLPWKAKMHHDGTSFEGWFIAGIGTKKGKQISYHLPIKKWGELRCVAYDKAPEWDGHTPNDVINRLKTL